MKNRDAKKGPKRAEKQKKVAGKFPFHRVVGFKKIIHKLLPWKKGD